MWEHTAVGKLNVLGGTLQWQTTNLTARFDGQQCSITTTMASNAVSQPRWPAMQYHNHDGQQCSITTTTAGHRVSAMWQTTLPVKGTKGKVHPRTGHECLKGEKRYSSTISSTSALYGGGWLTPRSGRFTPGRKTQYPLHRRLSGPQGRSQGFEKSRLLPPTAQYFYEYTYSASKQYNSDL
jgi:hypothetical protein